MKTNPDLILGLKGVYMVSAKSVLLSKTYWLNLLVAGIYPFLPESLKKPEYMTYFLVLLNLGLRAVTKGKIEFTA